MNDVVKGFRKIICLSFPPEVSNRPVVCNLGRLYDLSFNILKAEIGPRQEGALTIEVTGLEDDYRKGLEYLKESGVRITPVAQKIFRDEEACTHCGTCTALCPTRALAVDPATRRVLFDIEKCTACGMCTHICPAKAMHVEVENNGLIR